jgi:hypothetical protein
MTALREALEARIAHNLNFDQHVVELEALRGQFGHSIIILPFDEPLQNCSCVMFALGMRLEEASSFLGHFYASTQYLESLITKGCLKETEAKNKAIAVYWHDGRIVHAGVTQANGRIASKWGIGFAYEHKEWEVPSSYGSGISYHAPMDPDDAFVLLEKFHRIG